MTEKRAVIGFNPYRFQSSTSFGATPPKGMIVPKTLEEVIEYIKRRDLESISRAIRHTDIPLEGIEQAVTQHGSNLSGGDKNYIAKLIQKKRSGI